jgi:hypothetical protein
MSPPVVPGRSPASDEPAEYRAVGSPLQPLAADRPVDPPHALKATATPSNAVTRRTGSESHNAAPYGSPRFGQPDTQKDGSSAR